VVSRHLIRTFAALGVLAASFGAYGADECGENARKADGTMGEAYYKGVQQATDLITKKQYNEAITQLQNLTTGEGSPYEKAIAYYNLGFAYNGKEDAKNAAKAFKAALALNALPQQQHEQLQYNTGQLLVLDKQYDEGTKMLEDYLATACKPPSPDANVFLAVAYSEMKRFRDAAKQIDIAISKGKPPKENWLQLKLAMYYELKDFKTCAQTLTQLIAMSPGKADYWSQLSSVMYQMDSESDAVAILALAERQGFVQKPAEIRNLYNMYMIAGVPYKAGTFLQSAIDAGRLPADENNLSLVADAWINARELPKAEVVLRKLGDMSPKGDYYYKLGAMYGDNEQWKESQELIRQAIQKGGLKKTGDAWLRLAVAQYNLKDYKSAEASLIKATSFDDARKQASEWLQLLRQNTGATG